MRAAPIPVAAVQSYHGGCDGCEVRDAVFLAVLGLAVQGGIASAERFPVPGKTVRIIVPFSPGGQTDVQARAVQAANADRRVIDLAPAIEALRAEGHHSLRSMAAELNARVITAARGGAWTPAQISRLLKKCLVYPVRLGFGLALIPIRSVNKAVFQQPVS